MLDIKEKEALLCSKYNNVNRLLAILNVDRQDREDLLHNIFINALRSLKQLRDVEKMDAWLWTITRNEVNRYWRKIMRSREMLRSMDSREFQEHMASSGNGPHQRLEEEIERIFTREELIRALRRLPDKTLILFRLYYFEGYKLREIAKMTNENESTIKSRHQRGLTRLREMLEEMRGKEEDEE